MSELLIAALVLCGLAVVTVRRRSVAIALVSVQSLLLGVGALSVAHERSADFLVSGLALVVKAGVLPALLLVAMRRTRETQPVAAATPAVLRMLITAALALTVAVAMPEIHFVGQAAEHASFALVAIGMAIVVLRRPTIFQALGLLVAENGVYLLAISAPGGMPFVLELGVLFDVTLVLTVVVGFAHRIHGEFGSGDTDVLRGLRD